jgi:hypothetical protein
VLALALASAFSGGTRESEVASPSLSVHSSVSLTLICAPIPSSSWSSSENGGGGGKGREGGGFVGAVWNVRETTWTEPLAKGSESAMILERAKGWSRKSG